MYPTKESGDVLIQGWIDQEKKLSDMFNLIEKSIGLDSDGPLFETVWKAFDSYTSTLKLLLGDSDWLDWFYMENDMGKNGYPAGYVNGATEPIRTASDIHNLIIEGRSHV